MNTPVSFELAKLLLEKKVSWETGDEDDYEKGRHGYFRHKSGNIAAISYYHFDTNHNGVQWTNLNVPAPTIADVVMWLYEKHNIWIHVTKYKDHSADVNDDYEFTWDMGKTTHKTPMKAYEAAIEYCLTELI